MICLPAVLGGLDEFIDHSAESSHRFYENLTEALASPARFEIAYDDFMWYRPLDFVKRSERMSDAATKKRGVTGRTCLYALHI